MTDARTTIQGNRLGLGDKGVLIVDGTAITRGNSSSETVIQPTTETGTTAAAFRNSGVTQFGSSVGTSTYTISDPYNGASKWLIRTATAGSSLTDVVSCSSLASFSLHDSTGGSTVTKLNFAGSSTNGYAQAVHLQGISATKWIVASQNSTLVTATS